MLVHTLLFALWLAPAGEAQKLKPGPIVEGELGRALDAHLSALDADTGGFCGAALVAVGGKIVLEKGYGVADADTKAPIAHDAIFDWASVSKQFTAAAVLKLEQAKKLSIDDTLEKHFKKQVPEDKKAITLKMMLSHTSGLEKGFSPDWKWDSHSRDSLFELVLGLRLTSKPGEKFEYNNTPYGFLAGLVEIVSKQSFEDYCIEQMFRPADMQSASFIGHKSLDLKRVPRDDRGTGNPFPYGPVLDWGYRGCGGVMASVHDMFLWDRALRGDKLLSNAQKTKLYTPVKEGYALGWYVGQDEGATRIEHGGDTRRTTCYFGRWIEPDVVVAIAYTYKPAVYKFDTGRALAKLARGIKTK
jgi:CubicO group peptidase (beta-lactamase class C family)